MPLALIACGGATHSDTQFVYDQLSLISYERGGIDLLIEGGAKGADRQASNWAIANKVKHERIPADWKKFWKAAGPKRNQEMLDQLLFLRKTCQWQILVVAFPSARMALGKGGTLDMITRARTAGVEVLLPTKEHTNA